MKKGKLIYYDDDEMHCYDIVGASVSANTYCDETYNPTIRINGAIVNGDCEFDVNKKPIELDPTTMLRIAKYNNKVEVEKLIKKKEGLEKEINALLQKLNDLSKFAYKFIESDCSNIQEFAENEFNDDDTYNYDD